MKKLFNSIAFIIASVAMYATSSLTCDSYSKVDILSTGGTTVATQDPDNHCNWTLVATPAAGYKLAYWTDIYGGKYLDPTLEIAINTTSQNALYQATFVRDNAYIYEWQADALIYRSDTTNILSGSTSDGFVETFIDGVEIEDDDNAVTRQDYGLWSKNISAIADGNTYAGKPMHMIIYNSCRLPSAVIDAIVPVMVAEDTNASSLDFHSDVANTDVEVFDGATLTIDVDKTINGYLDVHAGGKVIIADGAELDVKGIIMRGNGITKKWPQLEVNGTIVNHNSNTIYYDYTLDNSTYYPFSLPYTIDCAAATNAITGGVPAFLAYIYNGAKRESNVRAWEEYDDMAVGAKFEAGKGYAIFSVPSNWNGTRQQQAVMRFPMVKDFSESGEGDKYVETRTNASPGDINEKDLNWNFIGNPYLSTITMGHAAPSKVSAWQGVKVGDDFESAAYGSRSLRYITYSNDGFNTYEQEQLSGFEMLPFNSYFTQTSYGNSLLFSKIPEESSAPRRVSTADSNIIEEIETGIILSQGEKSDHVGLLFGDFTDNYELNADLAKEFGSAQPMSAYSLMGTTPMAFQALSIDAMTRPIPVGYRKAGSEQMTFSFDDSRYNRSLIDGLWLTDIVTGQVTNLLVEDYTFTPESAQDDSRFYLSCERRKVVDVTTDVEEIEQQRNIIRVFDMFGREMHGDVNSLPQGVYVLMDNLGNTTKEILGK